VAGALAAAVVEAADHAEVVVLRTRIDWKLAGLRPAGSIFAPLSTCASTVWHAEAVVKPLLRFREVIRKRAGTTLPDVISEDSPK
jgi:hypothetical protein